MNFTIKPLAWLICGALLLALGGCDATELEENLVNVNEPNPESASLEFVFNGIQTEFPKFLGGFENGPNDDLAEGAGVFDRTNELMRYINMGGGNMYNNAFFGVDYDFIWRQAYAEVLPDVRAVKENAAGRGQTAVLGIAQVYEAYTYLTLVDMFGDVPFAEALQGADNFSPAASPGSEVYAAMLDTLDAAIANLNDGVGAPSYDIIYGGDPSKWIKAANTLKMKAALNLRLVDASRARTIIDDVVGSGNFIQDMSDDLAYRYGTLRTNTNSRSRLYSRNYETGATEYIGNSFMFDLLTDYSITDPRLRYYVYRQDLDATDEDFFTLSCQALDAPDHFGDDQPFCTAAPELGYWGRDHGDDDGIPPDDVKRTIVGVYPAGGAFDDDSGEGLADDNGAGGAMGAGILPMMLSPFVDFMRAEAALTLGTSDDAEARLLEGVRKSMMSVHAYSVSFGVTIPDTFSIAVDTNAVNTYLSEVEAAYDDADSDDARLNVIGREYYKALWLNGLEAYNLYRRTGTPNDLQPTRDPNGGTFPRTVLYPNVAVTLNSNISNRDITNQVFWDTNPAGFID